MTVVIIDFFLIPAKPSLQVLGFFNWIWKEFHHIFRIFKKHFLLNFFKMAIIFMADKYTEIIKVDNLSLVIELETKCPT